MLSHLITSHLCGFELIGNVSLHLPKHPPHHQYMLSFPHVLLVTITSKCTIWTPPGGQAAWIAGLYLISCMLWNHSCNFNCLTMVNLELNMRVLQNMCSNCDLQMAAFEGVILLIQKRCPCVRLFDQLYIRYELASLSVVLNIHFLRLLRPRNLFFPGCIQCATYTVPRIVWSTI